MFSKFSKFSFYLAQAKQKGSEPGFFFFFFLFTLSLRVQRRISGEALTSRKRKPVQCGEDVEWS